MNILLNDIAPDVKLPLINFDNNTDYYSIKKNYTCNLNIVW